MLLCLSALSLLLLLRSQAYGVYNASVYNQSTAPKQRRLAHLLQNVSAAPVAAPGPLDGITIIDAGQAITGPLACSMLGDMGATVLKVESPNGLGDLNRPSGPKRNGRSIYLCEEETPF